MQATKLKIISSDDHMDLNVLPPDLFVERVPAALRDRAPRVVETAEGKFWQAEGRTLGPSGRKAAGLIVVKDHGYRPGDPKARLEDMDQDGVYCQIIYGPPTGFALEDKALKLEVERAYNDWAAEYNATDPNRLVLLAQIPGWDAGVAAEETRRVAKLGHKGAQIAVHESPDPLFEPAWEPFWAAVEEAQIPISFHLSGGLHSIKAQPNSWRHAAMVAVVPMQMDEGLVGMIFSGMCERHPGIRVVMGESGLGWVPYVLERMDRQYHKYYDLMKDYRMKKHPVDTFHEQMYVTYEEDTIGVELIPRIGAGNVMWASDFPHGDSTWPNSRKVIEESLAALSDEDRRKVVSENAAALYKIS
jgi:predicted TIM-barrel fold metal-dependent hydrolase